MNDNQIKDIYDKRCLKYSEGWQASLWASKEDQEERFSVASAFFIPNSSVLDVGCGQGDFYLFCKERGIPLRYRGIDMSSAMINQAMNNNPEAEFMCSDFMKVTLSKYDYVLTLGTFNLKTDQDMYEYLEQRLVRCFEICTQAVSASILIDVEDESGLFNVYSSEKVFQIAKSISKYINFNTVSMYPEAILSMYKL